MALSLNSIPALQPVVHAQGVASDATEAAKETGKSLEGVASSTKEAAKGTGKSLTDTVGKVKTDANKTKDSAKTLDLMGTAEGAGQTKQDVKDLSDSANDLMKNPFGK
jgi:hypothetical protein